MEWNISSRMAQVSFIYFLTLIFIFNIKVFAFFIISEYLVNGERYRKHQIGSWVFATELRHCEFCTL